MGAATRLGKFYHLTILNTLRRRTSRSLPAPDYTPSDYTGIIGQDNSKQLIRYGDNTVYIFTWFDQALTEPFQLS